MKDKIAKISAVIITITFVAILLSQIEVSNVITTLAGIDPLYLIAGFVLYVCSYFFRTLRFHILLNREVRIKDLFNIVCVHNIANNILPARTGELSYIYLLKKLHNKKTGEGVATLMVARVFDFITISCLFSISALIIQDLPEMIVKVVWVIALFMILIVIFLIILLYFGILFLNLAKKFFRIFNSEKKQIIDYLLRKGEEIVESFERIKSSGRVIEIIIVSMGIWLSLYSVNYILVTAMNINLSFFMVLLASTFSIFTTILPIQGIGGFGTLEGGWAVGFITVGLTKEIAISSGFAYHVIVYLYFLVLGCIGLLSIKIKIERWRSY
ncbi:MAG TPA: flippase-like domain-containing protein [Candidatus Desulfofervidus auxilii]|uniref:Flippase-like domain-containing protein n=1 Tax=Desulfofervidus auxilii TaxID=1621989 RepID=A0A7C0U3Q3_DESA2|nr:flippase-like domain-containing protein [Candidatus Desulfofervidus auxilii]